MKRLHLLIIIALFALPLLGTQYAGEIFRLAPGVSNQAMGGTGLGYDGSLAAGWWNPALLAGSPESGAELMRSEYFEGLLSQNQISLVLGGKNRISFHLNHLAIDKIKLTQLENPADSLSNDNRPIVWKTVTNQDFILSAAMGRKLGERVSMGVAPKIAYRDLAGNSGYGFGADLGVLWDVGKGFVAAGNLRDFFGTMLLWQNGTFETAIPSLDLETSWQGGVSKKDIPVRLALRAELFAEDRGEASMIQMGKVTADLHGGVMVMPIPSLLLMSGYDVDSFTAGIGIRWVGLGLDYAFKGKATDGLGNTHKVSASYRW